MNIVFRPAVRQDVGLIIGLAGGTGSGKTYTGMELATGLSGGKRFAVIDTEASRARHYADDFQFDHVDIVAPFRPSTYLDAIEVADKMDYPVIMVDSMSHEWAGDGGILDWQEDEYTRLGGNDAIKLLSWSKPKQAHKRMVSRLLQCRAHLILCFRAEPHVEMVKEGGRTKVVPKTGLTGYGGWFPVTEKNLPFEMTVSFMFMADKPGVPLPIKLPKQLRPMFPDGQEVGRDAGVRLAEWARGGKPSTASTPPHSAGPADAGADGSDATYIHPDQVTHLGDRLRENAIDPTLLLKAAKVPSLQLILAADYPRTMAWIDAVIDRKRSA